MSGCPIDQIIARSTRYIVVGCAARDCVAVICTDDTCEIAERIRAPARCRSSSQINRHGRRAIREINRIARARSTIQRIIARRTIEIIASGTAQDTVVPRTAIHGVIIAVTKTVNTKARECGAPRTAGFSQCIQMQGQRSAQTREAKRIRTAPPRKNLTGSGTDNNKVIAQTGIDMHTDGVRCNRIIARTASDRTVRRATQRVAIARPDNILDIAKMIRNPPRSRPCDQINRHRRCCVREIDCVRPAATTVDRVIAQSRIEQITARPANNTVIASSTRDRVAVITANNINKMTERIGTPARRCSCRQVDI